MATPRRGSPASPAFVRTFKGADAFSPPPATRSRGPSGSPVLAERDTKVSVLARVSVPVQGQEVESRVKTSDE